MFAGSRRIRQILSTSGASVDATVSWSPRSDSARSGPSAETTTEASLLTPVAAAIGR